MHEHLALDRVAGAGVADQADAFFAKLGDGLFEIVDLHRDEMDAFAEIGTRVLDPLTARAAPGRSGSLASTDFAVPRMGV